MLSSRLRCARVQYSIADRIPRNAVSRVFCIRKKSDIAFVFDIDGVLLRGSKALPYTKPALELLNKNEIPFIFLTNGGGRTEKERMSFLSKEIGIPLSPLQLVQSHTPMKLLAHNNVFNRVLVVGGQGDQARKCALEYGFKDVVLPMDILRKFPTISPHHRYTEEHLKNYAVDPSQFDETKPFDAILVFNDPRDLGTDVQVVMDLLNSEGGVIGSKRHYTKNSSKPEVSIIFSNNDFLWANEYNLPRFGQGAFRIIIESLFRECNELPHSQNLESTILGKPFKISYNYAHHALLDWTCRQSGSYYENPIKSLSDLEAAPVSPFKTIYMVGDNPESDIRGANTSGWDSLLLKSGVYKESDKLEPKSQPSCGVFENVFDSVKFALSRNNIAH